MRIVENEPITRDELIGLILKARLLGFLQEEDVFNYVAANSVGAAPSRMYFTSIFYMIIQVLIDRDFANIIDMLDKRK